MGGGGLGRWGALQGERIDIQAALDAVRLKCGDSAASALHPTPLTSLPRALYFTPPPTSCSPPSCYRNKYLDTPCQPTAHYSTTDTRRAFEPTVHYTTIHALRAVHSTRYNLTYSLQPAALKPLPEHLVVATPISRAIGVVAAAQEGSHSCCC